MNWKFWKKKSANEEPEIKNVRTVGDIMISVVTGLHGTKDVKVSGWNAEMAYGLFQRVWAHLDEDEK